MADPEPRRRRPPVSCTLCRKRKIRCNRGNPCNNCVKSRNGVCVYGNHSPQTPQRTPRAEELSEHSFTIVNSPKTTAHPRDRSTVTDTPSIFVASRDSSIAAKSSSSVVPSNSSITGASPSSVSTPITQQSTQNVEWMKIRIKQLEDQLPKTISLSTPSPAPVSNIDIEVSSSLAGTFHIQHGSRLFGECQVVSGSMMHKSRLFGQSHWCNGLTLFLEILEMMEPHIRGETSVAFTGLQKCKYLAKIIKTKRTPPWPTIPTADLPAKDVTDNLINCYLRTTEKVYRILHIPTFRRDYEALWQPNSQPAAVFLIQLKLILAIGAITYDENFSLRVAAKQWVYEAHTWFSDPEFKSGLSIQSLQTSVLLLLARELVGVGDKIVWITAGSLLRMAVYMGLNRDPAYLPKRTIRAAEMRRRLWNTILEITLQSSISSGGPPLISLEDFNTKPPGNFDDDQLIDENPVPKPEEDFTEVSIAIALRKTFPLRLAITKFLNEIGSYSTYEKALQLDADLRVAYKSLRRTFQSPKSGQHLPSPFELNVVEFIMQRYLSSIHVPFFGAAFEKAAYAFSRKVVIEGSLKIWRLVYQSSSVTNHSTMSFSDDFSRLAVAGSGFFRIVSFQASSLISIELKAQLEEEESLGPATLRPDLFAVLDEAKRWNWRAIEIGETNIKGYLLMCLMAVPIQGYMQGITKEEFPPLLVKAAEEVAERCFPVLEEMAGQNETEEYPSYDQICLDMQLDWTEDLDFTMSDVMFNVANLEQMGWMSDETRQAL